MRIRINFASREYLLARRVYVALLALAAVGAAVFVLNFASYKAAAGERSAFLAQLKAQERIQAETGRKLAGLKARVKDSDVRAAAREAQFANAAISRRVFSWTEFLNRLEGVVPSGVGITAVTPNFATLDVDISGTALGMEQLTEFMEALTKSPYFEDIPPVFHVSESVVDKDVGMTLQVFSLKIRYNPAGRGKEGGKG